MEYGIQRRTIYLVPPDANELEWIFQQFDVPDIHQNLGFREPLGAEMRRRRERGDHVWAVIKISPSQERIGFIVMFPPWENFDAWSFAYAIPDARHRDAYHALNATDAMAHYMFEHLRVDRVGWETWEGNRAADAIVRRLGYALSSVRELDGRTYKFYVIDRDAWVKRRAKLDAGEKNYPSGIGATFVKLNAPYYPIGPAIPGAGAPGAAG